MIDLRFVWSLAIKAASQASEIARLREALDYQDQLMEAQSAEIVAMKTEIRGLREALGVES